jgi:tetratricopeptide (TPR) repeat protein
MNRTYLRLSGPFLNATILAIAFAFIPASTHAQDPNRARAFELFDSSNFVAAVPLLEKLAASSPDDVAVLSRLGFALYAASAVEKDQALRQKQWDRAREILTRSRSLGDNSNLTRTALDALTSKTPNDRAFSNMKNAEAAMREGEDAFVKGDLDKALASYQRALELDPQLYEAALYAGDMEFKKGYMSTDARYRSDAFDRSGVWFAKAIGINPNRETAYRYWGDALDAQGKTDDARDKFVDAIVSEPYNRGAYNGLTQWADRHKVPLGHPKIDQPKPATKSAESGEQTTILIDATKLDPKSPGYYWAFYDLTRAAYKTARFSREYPDEKAYRHSLKEEAGALRAVAEIASKDLKEGKAKTVEDSVNNLIKLNDAGLLEAYVLFARADAGIAREYDGYRKDNRDKLRRYWLEVVIGK